LSDYLHRPPGKQFDTTQLKIAEMNTPFKVLKLARCGPSDVAKELSAVGELVDEWNNHHGYPAYTYLKHQNWTTDAAPDMSGRPQEIINRQVIDDTDILVAVFWTRFGTPTGKADSGTEEEVLRAIKKKKRVMLYFSDLEEPRRQIAPDQHRKVSEFRERMAGKGLYWTFRNRNEFKELFRRHLALVMNEVLNPKPERAKRTSKNKPSGGPSISANNGSVAFSVDGGIHAPVTINNNSSGKQTRGYAPNSIGADADRRNYLDYLCDLWAKYMTQTGSPYGELLGRIGKQIKSRFRLRSRTRNDLSVGRFDDVVAFLVNEKLPKTPVGKKHVKNRRKLCRTFEEYVSGPM
jgi:hypothetical protein